MADVQEVVQNLRNIKTYLQCQAIEASANKNDVAREALIESQKDIDDALELLKKQHEIIEKYHKADSFLEAHGWKWERQAEQHDCRDCYQWLMCPNGMRGHINGTSIGFSSGECKDFRPLT